MNREIKFRAYHSKHGWLYFVIQPTPENRDQTISFGSAIGRQMLQEGLTRWGQFIGLKDKNGGEIYEGDILHSDFHGKDGLSHNFVVEYEAATGFIGGQTSGQNPRYCTTVIGNIYENPALLKDAAPNTQCTSACGNDYDCPHNDDSETEAI